MTTQGRCTPEQRESVGAFALGALEPAEADQVSAHLSECAECRAQYGEFLELLPLLASVTEQEAVTGPVRPEPEVLGRVLAAAEPVRAPSRARGPALRSKLMLAACAVLIAAGGVGAGVVMSGSGHQAVASWSASATGRIAYPGSTAWPVAATVKVSAADTGSYIELTMDDIPQGYECSLMVVTTAGQHEKGESWTAPSSGRFTIPDTVPTPPRDIAAVQVVLPSGQTLLTLDR